jgi:uncharacterized protein YndB with AHSA1/START domain
MRTFTVAAAAALTLAPASARAGDLIAPLDVRVEAHVRPQTALKGTWNVLVTPEQRGAWRGHNLALTETWQAGPRTPLRVRGRASGGPTRVHYVRVRYLKARTGEGVLTEVRMDGDNSEPTVLQCKAHGAGAPGDTIVTVEETSMQVVDEPRRGRVIIRGPGIAFLGPECRPPGRELPVRGVGMHPPDERRTWVPEGAMGRWEFAVPRAEFAAGGTFRFRDSYAYGVNIEWLTSSDLAGTQITSGTVAIDLRVRRNGR